MTKIILIRHGQTNLNLRKRYCGWTDISLSIQGKKQVEKLSRRIKGESIHRVYSSDRKRALETAEILFKGARIEKVPDLREIHFGIFEGKNHKEILKEEPLIYKKWLKRPFNAAIPGGEIFTDFKKRIIRAFKKIVLHNKGKTIAVVCHGGAISVIINNVIKLENFWKAIPGFASLSIIECKYNKAEIVLFNDTSHLPRPFCHRVIRRGKKGRGWDG